MKVDLLSKNFQASVTKGFQFRLFFLFLFAVFTLFFGIALTKIQADSDLKKMVPLNHPYMQNLFKYKDQLSLGNDIRLAVENKKGSIFTKDYLETLKQISDEVFYLPGVDKSKLQSLWTPNVRWIETTIDGFRGGEVIPSDYNGLNESLEKVRQNILKSGQIGRLVADDFNSTIIYAPLFDQKIDYAEFTRALNEKVIQKYESDAIKIHVIGFAKKVGDLTAGAKEVAGFFLVALVVTTLLFYLYFRCIRSTIIVIGCSLLAVIWQLGLSHFAGIRMDPYSMLVPFLVFAIAVSHSIQIILMFKTELAEGFDNKNSAINTIVRLAKPGILALLSGAMGFATLYFIHIQVIRDLALATSLGVFVIIFTNLLLIPVILSYCGATHTFKVDSAVNQVITIANSFNPKKGTENKRTLWLNIISFILTPEAKKLTIILVFFLFIIGVYFSRLVQIGDLDQGAPEFRPDARYNQDVAFISAHYSVSADVLVVMVATPSQACTQFKILDTIDYFHAVMERLPEVQSVISLTTVSKITSVGLNEGNYKWASIPRNPVFLNQTLTRIPGGMIDLECSLAPVLIFLKDHKAASLQNVVSEVKKFAAENDSLEGKFLLASGNAGVEAATNESIEIAKAQMLFCIYFVVTLLVLLIFRSLHAVFCIIFPLMLTSLLCEALMAILGIGVKVATLPVIALGVGIGVDYGIYIYNRIMENLHAGASIEMAIEKSLETTGRAVILTGFTLAVSVGAWAFSSIKFQADMGVLLCFMFLWNMIGALWLLPVLAKMLYGTRVLKGRTP